MVSGCKACETLVRTNKEIAGEPTAPGAVSKSASEADSKQDAELGDIRERLRGDDKVDEGEETEDLRTLPVDVLDW